MAAITDTVEIARRPEEVFAYLDDLSRHGEWQTQIESVELLTEGPTRVGTRAVDTRRVPGGLMIDFPRARRWPRGRSFTGRD